MQQQNLDSMGESLRDVYKRLELFIKAEHESVEAGRNVGDAFKEFGIKQQNPSPILGK